MYIALDLLKRVTKNNNVVLIWSPLLDTNATANEVIQILYIGLHLHFYK
jgi:hypothetical protein